MSPSANEPIPAQARPLLSLSSPRFLNGRALFVLSAYGLLLLMPVLISLLVVSVLPFGRVTVILPLCLLAVTLVFLPFGFGNTYVGWLVRRFSSAPIDPENEFIVQLTAYPRLRKGFGAAVEDADDIGRLRVGEDALRYEGDSLQLIVPYKEIQELRRENVGWRGLFLYGPRTVLVIPALDCSPTLRLGERQSILLPGSRKIARRMHAAIAAKLAPRARPGA